MSSLQAGTSTPKRGVVRLLLLASGFVFLFGTVALNTRTVEWAARVARRIFHKSFLTPDVWRIHDAVHAYFAIAAACFVWAWAIGRFAPLDRFCRQALVEKLALALFVIAVPLAGLEIGLRPYLPNHEKTTNLFMKDDRLGWKLRPGAADTWGDVEVRINPRGFRGPVIPYEKPRGVARVVYLGDSVTFGYRVARWEDTYPFLVGDLLGSRDSVAVETVNLAVEGYSQWQQALVLADEGDRYQPDLVVVAFVLNDVTEMFYLARFGGPDEGYQLRHSYTSRWDRLLSKSAVVYQIQNVVREVKAKRKLGQDLRLGAVRQQALDVETLMKYPDQANVKVAWDIALADLQSIVDHCTSRNVPVLVVVFPFAIQLSKPEELSTPQRVLVSYAHARGFDTFDLLPPLVEHARATGMTADSLFIDQDHLSVEGHRVVAAMLEAKVAGILARRTRPEVSP